MDSYLYMRIWTRDNKDLYNVRVNTFHTSERRLSLALIDASDEDCKTVKMPDLLSNVLTGGAVPSGDVGIQAHHLVQALLIRPCDMWTVRQRAARLSSEGYISGTSGSR